MEKFPEMEDDIIPGELRPRAGEISLNNGRRAVILKVVNNGDRPVQVHSAFLLHFAYLVWSNMSLFWS